MKEQLCEDSQRDLSGKALHQAVTAGSTALARRRMAVAVTARVVILTLAGTTLRAAQC